MLTYEAFAVLITILVLAPIFGAIILLCLFIFEKRIDLLESEKKKIALERELQQSLYHQLTQQIQPHFLFNTLNTILSLARLQRTDEVVRSLEIFSLFLKGKYKTTDLLIPISEELAYTNYYIEIQKMRFRSRLSVSINSSEDLHNSHIPPFVIQTLVENSFKHGLEKKAGQAILNIHLYNTNNRITLLVSDNGTQNEPFTSHTEESGYGLENIKQRFQLFFQEQTTFSFLSTKENGTTVEITWPFITEKNTEEVIQK